jgi:hypothetical protein
MLKDMSRFPFVEAFLFRLCRVVAVTALIFGGFAMSLVAEPKTNNLQEPVRHLQASAAPASKPPTVLQSSPVMAATLKGSVLDSHGKPVANVQIHLINTNTQDERSGQTDDEGRFDLSSLPTGPFVLTVLSDGSIVGSANGFLRSGETLELAAITMHLSATSSEVNVTATEHEIAEAEVKQEEQQRVVAIVPNYFVTYSPNPTPLSAKQKFNLGWHVVIDPTAFAFAAASAGIEQWNHTIPGYGPGPQGYGKRYGAALALSTSSTVFRGSLFPALFRQDPRYYYKGTGTVWSRTKYALATAVICKGDNGKWQANYSGILGDLSAGALSNAYYPASSRHGAGLTFEDGLLSTAGVGIGHLFQEFVFRRLSTHVPAATPKP